MNGRWIILKSKNKLVKIIGVVVVVIIIAVVILNSTVMNNKLD